MNETPPKDGPGVEILPGIYIPLNRFEELTTFIELNPDVAEAFEETRLERTAIDPLTDDLCTCVPFQFQSELEWKLAMLLMERSTANIAKANQVRSVTPFSLNFGT